MVFAWVKKMLLPVILLAGMVLAGADKINWQEWQLIYGKNLTPEYAAALRGNEKLNSRTVTIPTAGIDLNKVLNLPVKSGKKQYCSKKSPLKNGDFSIRA